MSYLEPVYLNEKMVLNAAAYLFKGVSSESEVLSSTSKKTDANAKIGMSFLTTLLGKIDIGVSGESAKNAEVRTVKRYTLGGLHMSVIDELSNRKQIFNYDDSEVATGMYIKTKAVLQPVDIYQLVESLQTAAPLITQFLKNFGVSLGIQKKQLDGFLMYEKPIIQILEAIERDYLKSKQLEMIMCNEGTGEPIGVVDIDVADYDPSEIKSKLTDGSFFIIGKLTKTIDEHQELSLVQRSFLSYVMKIMENLVEVTSDINNAQKYRDGIAMAQPFVEKFCRLSIKGPAYRLIAMSVCA